MSVKFCFARLVEYTQTFLDSYPTDETSRLVPGTSVWETKVSYDLIELGTVGWSQGAHFRVKRLSKDKALRYVNKLHAGKWIDDDQYTAAFGSVEELVFYTPTRARLEETIANLQELVGGDLKDLINPAGVPWEAIPFKSVSGQENLTTEENLSRATTSYACK